MKRYHKVTSRLWEDRRVCCLSDPGKLLYVFIVTHPLQTCLGAFRCTRNGLATELGWKRAKLNAQLNRLIELGLVECDDDGFCLAVPDFFTDNLPENPNVVKSWQKALEYIPDCALRDRQLARAAESVKRLRPTFSDAVDGVLEERQQYGHVRVSEALTKGFAQGSPEGVAEGVPESLPNQYSKQEPEPELQPKPHASTEPSPQVPALRGIADPVLEEWETDFDDFWRAYPRKSGKVGARVAWGRLRPNRSTVREILASVKQQSDSLQWQRDGGRYIPNPAKWLVERRWEDEPQVIPSVDEKTLRTLEAGQRFLQRHARGDGWHSTEAIARQFLPAGSGSASLQVGGGAQGTQLAAAEGGPTEEKD